MTTPLFIRPHCDAPFTPSLLVTARAVPATEFELEDIVVGRSVMSGMTTGGRIAVGVVTRVIRGCGFAFDSPYQNGILWSQLWLHDDDCPVAVRIAAEILPEGCLRRTDSGSDYGVFGWPDCAFWERAGVEPLFVASSNHYWPHGDPAAVDVRVWDELVREEPTEEGPYRRAWERQYRAVAAERERTAIHPVSPPVSPPGRAPFMEPVLSRPASPPVTPDRPTRPMEPAAPERPTGDAEERIAQAFSRLLLRSDVAASVVPTGLAQLTRLAEMVADMAGETTTLPPPSWADKPLERQGCNDVAAEAVSDSESEEDVVDGTEMVRRLRFADVFAAPLPMTVGHGCALFVAVVAILWVYAVCLAHR